MKLHEFTSVRQFQDFGDTLIVLSIEGEIIQAFDSVVDIPEFTQRHNIKSITIGIRWEM